MMATDNFCFYLQDRLIQTSQTGGQWYGDTSLFSIPCINLLYYLLKGMKLRRKGSFLFLAASNSTAASRSATTWLAAPTRRSTPPTRRCIDTSPSTPTRCRRQKPFFRSSMTSLVEINKLELTLAIFSSKGGAYQSRVNPVLHGHLQGSVPWNFSPPFLLPHHNRLECFPKTFTFTQV